MQITGYTLHRVRLKLPLPIGDSQVCYDEIWLTVLELATDTDLVGLGFERQFGSESDGEGKHGMPSAGLTSLNEQFSHATSPLLEGRNPFELGLRITRPRGNNVGAGFFMAAVETALWDLMAKSLGLPLYRLLGGTSARVPAYGSTLDFHLSDADFHAKLEQFSSRGFRAVKVKVGHPDVQWDLKRLRIVYDVMGSDVDLMVDANEAWSPKEAIRRAHIYRDAGFDIFWIEDPCLREDAFGYANVCAAIDFTRINAGEYVGFSRKRRLLECHGVDVLNLQGSISTGRALAHLAGDFGVPVSLGNTACEIGVHIAASLPECIYMEYSDLIWNHLAREPVQFEAGYAVAPDRPGHGIELDREQLDRYSEPG